jgi:hypothetical protein
VQRGMRGRRRVRERGVTGGWTVDRLVDGQDEDEDEDEGGGLGSAVCDGMVWHR